MLRGASSIPDGLTGGARTFSAPPPAPCGTELAMAGYSVTLSDTSAAAHAFAGSPLLTSSTILPEFVPVTDHAQPIQMDAATHALGLDEMRVVGASKFAGQTPDTIVTRLAGQPGVIHAEKILLQSTDKRYLSCDYKLRDNTRAQGVAARARQALISHGVSAALLDDAGTAEFVSLRILGGRMQLQVAFVRRPVDGTSVSYVAFEDPGTRDVTCVARANWYAVDPA